MRKLGTKVIAGILGIWILVLGILLVIIAKESLIILIGLIVLFGFMFLSDNYPNIRLGYLKFWFRCHHYKFYKKCNVMLYFQDRDNDDFNPKVSIFKKQSYSDFYDFFKSILLPNFLAETTLKNIRDTLLLESTSNLVAYTNYFNLTENTTKISKTEIEALKLETETDKLSILLKEIFRGFYLHLIYLPWMSWIKHPSYSRIKIYFISADAEIPKRLFMNCAFLHPDYENGKQFTTLFAMGVSANNSDLLRKYMDLLSNLKIILGNKDVIDKLRKLSISLGKIESE